MELWDIYDEDGNLTGRTMVRNDWHMKAGEYHKTVLGVIRRRDGRFLITRRVMTKSWAPGHWEISGGGVMAGETADVAVRRELLEETGIDVKDAEGGYQFTYKRVNLEAGDNYFVDIYRFDMDLSEADVKIQEAEVMEFKFASAEEIKELGKAGVFLHYDSIRRVFE